MRTAVRFGLHGLGKMEHAFARRRALSRATLRYSIERPFAQPRFFA